ncbi:MAG: branched-chain amino acid ABC transporter permease [Magnetovibrionaceae bacterium]
MDISALFVQLLNGLQAGLVLFLVASGLTLLFGIVGIINLAHGAFFMLGAYLCWWLVGLTDSLALALVVGTTIMAASGMVLEKVVFRPLQGRDHLDQVIVTFGLILVIDDLQKTLFGSDFRSVPIPEALNGSIALSDVQSYPVYRLFVALMAIVLAIGLAVLIKQSRLGMLMRAGATRPEMLSALGTDLGRLMGIVVALGAGLAAFAGMIQAPVSSVYPGMGDQVLILSFVVVVLGGTGSLKGAFWAALLVGLADTFGKVFFPDLASLGIYALMAAILAWRPQGLFGKAPA